MLGQIEIREAKQAGLDVTRLRATIDQTCGFQVVDSSVEGAHRLQRAAGEKFTTRKDCGERFRGVDRAATHRGVSDDHPPSL
jgi:hypothetical protein